MLPVLLPDSSYVLLGQADGPAGVLMPCFIWIAMPGWAIYLVHRMIMAELDTLIGFLALCATAYLGFLAWRPPQEWMGLGAVVAFFSIVVGLPLMEKLNMASADKALMLEQIETQYTQLRRNPQNAIATFRLAKYAYEHGMAGHALALAEIAIPSLPVGLFREEHKTIALWRMTVGPQHQAPVKCLGCGNDCHPGEAFCSKCWAPFIYDRIRGGVFRTSSVGRKVLLVWVAIVVAGFTIPQLARISPAIAIPVTLLLVGLCFWALFTAIRDTVTNS